ncbi:MAG: monovalent cation/H(+) antiporter subunit G [Candidatus Marinimicrobia bacterium]|nr:monovalent cation/H(+) antiporter subunit G [Candidatus Neomarinimicrobiota bacterium]
MMELFGAIITLIGSIFLFLGALGIFRMPDVYNKMQAGTKATTLGTILFLFGISIGHLECGCFGKIVILILFVVFTNPVSSNALARAAHFSGIKLTDKTVKDDLKKDNIENEGEKI